MDGERFDAIAKQLAVTSRRRALMAAGGGLMAALVGRSATPAAAQPVAPQATDLVCAGEPVLCNRSGVTATACGPNGSCRCARLTNGDSRCVNASIVCPRRRVACERNKDCPGSQVCAVVTGCCKNDTRATRACVTRC